MLLKLTWETLSEGLLQKWLKRIAEFRPNQTLHSVSQRNDRSLDASFWQDTRCPFGRMTLRPIALRMTCTSALGLPVANESLDAFTISNLENRGPPHFVTGVQAEYADELALCSAVAITE